MAMGQQGQIATGRAQAPAWLLRLRVAHARHTPPRSGGTSRASTA